jgi:coproporphyrinogen III oxidase
MSHRSAILQLFTEAQSHLVRTFEDLDGSAKFVAHPWLRPDLGTGTARIIEGGYIFERGGINVSAVTGNRMPADALADDPSPAAQPFFGTGISMVLHPRNPHAPSFHANFRYFELAAGDDFGSGPVTWWVGGGADLTPIYGFAQDATHFHSRLKDCCDRHDRTWYPQWKADCDKYFFLPHRNEMRGVGGIFFDHLTGDEAALHSYMKFIGDALQSIPDAYSPIVRRRSDMSYTEAERKWQLLRRGRYVEFNLLYDRGTRFGLQSHGNIEAILMSLPPAAGWGFDFRPEPGSPEAATASFLQPRDWVESRAGDDSTDTDTGLGWKRAPGHGGTGDALLGLNGDRP